MSPNHWSFEAGSDLGQEHDPVVERFLLLLGQPEPPLLELGRVLDLPR